MHKDFLLELGYDIQLSGRNEAVLSGRVWCAELADDACQRIGRCACFGS